MVEVRTDTMKWIVNLKPTYNWQKSHKKTLKTGRYQGPKITNGFNLEQTKTRTIQQKIMKEI